MGDWVAVAQRLKDPLNATDREPYWRPDEAERYLAAVADRRLRS